MKKVHSKDGTAIAFDQLGQGPAIILVGGAFTDRSQPTLVQLAALLAPHFTVFTYDRRGRGDSSDTAPYAVEREVEDLEALVNEAGGTVFVAGISSGAALALEATRRLTGIRKLALYEAPFVVDDSRPPISEEWTRINEAVSAGRRGDALARFLKVVGIPVFFVAVMPLMPAWSKLKGVAHTLPYDGAIVRDNQRGKPLPASHWAFVTIPTLVMDGGKSPVWMRHGMQALAAALPNAQYRTLEGQTHNVKAKAHAPALVEFFKG